MTLERRARAHALARAGHSNKSIAAELGVHEATVSRWLDGKSALDAAEVAQLLEATPELRPSERDVLARALLGASDAEVAKARGTSPRTVANQLRRAYHAIGAASRRSALARLRQRKK